MTDLGRDSYQPEAHEAHDFHDLVFVGSGASASYTVLKLLELLGRADSRPAARPFTIAIVERVPDQFGGLPYGRRSGFTSLIITSLRDFLPPAELANFSQWLSANKASVFDEFLSAGGQLSQAWWSRHSDAMGNNEWEGLYVPRYVFGRYLTDRLTAAIEHARTSGTAEVRLIHDEIRSIAADGTGYVLHGAHRDLQASRVVLTLGTPPTLRRLAGVDEPRGLVLIDDLFEPSLTTNLARIVAAADDMAASERPLNVLVIGGNASTMEAIYQLSDVAVGRLRGASISVVTPRGELPERLVPAGAPANFVARSLQSLQALQGSDGLTARAICEAGVADTQLAHRDGLTVSDALVATGPLVGALVRRLTRDESEEWAGNWGMQLGRFQRRAGPEYCDVVDELTAGGRLHFIAGAFSGIGVDGRITFVDSDGVSQRSVTPFDAVINCSGFTTLSQLGADSLLGGLLEKGLISTTRWGRGIAVDDSLSAAPGMYVMGPLLAGNVIASGAIWHMEHCGRIIAYAAVLAETLTSLLTAT